MPSSAAWVRHGAVLKNQPDAGQKENTMTTCGMECENIASTIINTPNVPAHSQTINFTIEAISRLLVPLHGSSCYRDKQNPNLTLYITAGGTRTFYVRKRIRALTGASGSANFPFLQSPKPGHKPLCLPQNLKKAMTPLQKRKGKGPSQLPLGSNAPFISSGRLPPA